ncbi:heterokaryon incompatibility protein-domain-containing protein [Phaeosphaeria sp. MPI-PUGE-AT-0046c]|nr:heterokaryon incompatibility protein-domain-containing protein [Phaeosphaeria sp. MPI-PUGE-AT-0046c]
MSKPHISQNLQVPFGPESATTVYKNATFPASFWHNNILLDPRATPHLFLESDLRTKKLGAIHERLWLAGLRQQARPLHRQKLLGRTIRLTERPDEHLIWNKDNIFIKPLPPYLLDHSFWVSQLCSNESLFGSAVGLLISYVWLVASTSDFAIAIEEHIIPSSITWETWRDIVGDIIQNIDTLTAQVNRRYHYGELRLSRLNTLYRFNISTLSLRNFLNGFMATPTWYTQFFERNFSWILAAFIYITVILSAMQVGLATSHLQGNAQFQDVSFGIAITRFDTRRERRGNGDPGRQTTGTSSTVVLDSTLCNRCFELELGRFLRGDVDAAYGRIARISLSSLDERCSLCQQFRTVLQIANGWEASPTTHTQFYLSRHVFDALLTRIGSFYGHYMGIRFEHTPQTIRLFPTHGIMRGSTSDNVVPMGRALGPSISDFESIGDQLKICRLSHDWACQPTSPMTEVLRLIDCRSRQIISAALNQPYVCLSYVWGQNVIMEQMSGSKLPDRLPKTVEDAMFIALKLGVPFLWVDRYCIDQHNDEEKHAIIQHMDRIYKGAELTIIAAVGNDPNHGIPGICGTARKPQYRLSGEHTTYVAAEEVAVEIAQSKWASRGWYVFE